MKEATGVSKEKFESFYTKTSRLLMGNFSPKKDRLSQIDILDIGESYSMTLTFEQDPRKDVKVKSGLLEISTEWRDSQNF